MKRSYAELSQLHTWDTDEWAALQTHAASSSVPHLRDLLQDEQRNQTLTASLPGLHLDYSRQCVTTETMQLLFALGRKAELGAKIQAMKDGVHINTTEDRAVGHMALRAPKSAPPMPIDDATNAVEQVHQVLDQITAFADKVRNGAHVGATGKALTDVISIGIGGSYLGPEFVFEALRHDKTANTAAKGRRLRFLANVDPVDVHRAMEGLNPETTLVIICSKTFTTAETMLNARTVKDLFEQAMPDVNKEDLAAQHIVACSANVAGAQAFGILAENVFGFWDWVGGRYSVCSAIGMLPLTLQYGSAVTRAFLDGAHAMDNHFTTAPMESNMPVLMGLTSIWNSSFLGHSSRALLPYSQALLRFPAHIQQVDMESNGKRVALDGTVLPMEAGEINFGEPGTNGQHSFYQLIHQGRTIPCDLIGIATSQTPLDNTSQGEVVTNHQELMSNFFAQADALAYGKTIEDLKADNVPESLWSHKEFPGNRPSLSLLMKELNAFSLGQLLALYEHRTAVQGFVWGINSFDQWGVELGKSLAKKGTCRSIVLCAALFWHVFGMSDGFVSCFLSHDTVRSQLSQENPLGDGLEHFNSSTRSLMTKFCNAETAL
jgi:glucose-6-phosphate isomerase